MIRFDPTSPKVPGLRVCVLPDGNFAVSDNIGPLAVCDYLGLMELLHAEASGTSKDHEGQSTMWFWAGAREWLRPGSAAEFVTQMKARHQALKESVLPVKKKEASIGRGRHSPRVPSPEETAALMKELGLE